MEKYTLDDVNYSFKPIKIFSPDPDYRVDEEKLKESMQKSRELIARVHKDRGEKEELSL